MLYDLRWNASNNSVVRDVSNNDSICSNRAICADS